MYGGGAKCGVGEGRGSRSRASGYGDRLSHMDVQVSREAAGARPSRGVGREAWGTHPFP